MIRTSARSLLPGVSVDPFLAGFAFVLGIFLTAYAAALYLQVGGDTGLSYLSNVAYHVPLIVAVLMLSLAALRSAGVSRLAWLMATGGAAFLAAGEITWSYYDMVLGREVPLPSLADALYYPGDLLLIAAFVLLVMPRSSGKATWKSLVDACLVAVALAVLSWDLVLQPAAQAEGLSHLGLASTLGYPLMDLVMLIVVVAAMYRQADGEVSLPVFLLGLGTAAIAISDTLYVRLATVQGYDPTGNPVEFGWVVGYALFALSGAVQLRHGASRESPAVGMPAGHSALSFAVPYLISVPVLVLLATTSLSGSADPAITAGACILVLGIALRQWITILELRDRERLIRHMAYHDPLTGLPNRSLLEDRTSQAIAYARRHGSGLAFLSIDLDKFKIVNDARGHLFGDKFLRAVAAAIRTSLRETDTLARVGGDEFVALLPGVDSSAIAAAMSQKILAALHAMEIDGKPFPSRASIGAALYPQDGDSTEVLWSRADAAMYAAKQGGRDGLKVVYQPGAGSLVRPLIAS